MSNFQSALQSTSSITAKLSAVTGLLSVAPQNTVGYQPQARGSLLPMGNAFLFHYEGENSVLTECDITDHWIEDNTAIQDQIAHKPIVITVHGYIGELNDLTPFGLQYLKTLANKLTVISAYTPSLSTTALIAYNEAVFAAQTALNLAGAAIGAVSSLGNFISGGNAGQNVINADIVKESSNQNKQQTAYIQFYTNQTKNVLYTVQTPWAVFQNMAIQSLKAVQDESTNVITDFEITFKQMRFAATLVTNANNVQGRLAQATAALSANGAQALTSNVPFPVGTPTH